MVNILNKSIDASCDGWLKFSIVVFGSLFIMTILAASICTNLRVNADTDVEDTITITVNSSCTLTGSIPSGSEHSATLTPGQNTPNIGITNMTAVCNDAAGYDIYAVGYSNNEWKNTDLISVQNNNTYTIATGTATSGNTSNWAMKLSAGTGDAATIVTSPTNYSAYAAVPNDYTKVAYYPSTTAGTGGSSFTTTYQVFTSLTQAAGTYEGKVKYTLIHPHVSDNSNKPAAKDPDIFDYEYMQDLADLTSVERAAIIAATPEETTHQLKDSRDEKVYNVTKLKDGKVWMTSNLNLAGGTELYSDDSNVAAENTRASQNPYYTLPASSTSGFSSNGVKESVYNSNNETSSQTDCYDNHPCNSYYTYEVATVGSAIQAMVDNDDAPYSICPRGWRLPSSHGYTDSSSDFRALVIAYGGSKSVSLYDSSTNPTGVEMYNKLGPGTAANFLLAGFYSLSRFAVGGTVGGYQSSSSYSSDPYGHRFFWMNSGTLSAANSQTRGVGYSVRCVLNS